ncbi:LuxR family transcriptional regulator [Blastococcus sp. SYSU DS0973]
MARTQTSTDLSVLADELLDRARTEHAGRAGRTLPHPVDGMRQTVIALRAGAELAEHETPGPASLLVVRGAVRLMAGDLTVPLTGSQVTPVPDRRHSLHADEDAVVLLTVAVPRRAPAAR